MRGREVQIPLPEGEALPGRMLVRPGARGLAVFAHPSGSSRYSPRNQYVAEVFQDSDLGTLLLDLLTSEEELVDLQTAQLRFDIELLAHRLVTVIDWISGKPETRPFRIGCFGSSTGAAAALMAAAERSESLGAVVSRGGRPDLAWKVLDQVRSPTLLIVGERDEPGVRLNRQVFDRLQCRKELSVIPGASRFFEEPGALEEVSRQAAHWFSLYLSSPRAKATESSRSGPDQSRIRKTGAPGPG